MKCSEGQIAMVDMESTISKQQFSLEKLRKGIENHLATIVAWVFAIVLLGIGVVLAFPSNSLFGGSAHFVTDKAQGVLDLAYFASSIGFVVIVLQYEKVLAKFLQLIGKVYMVIALIGFAKLGSQVYSEWVAVINLWLGMSFVLTGSILQDYRQRLLVARLIAKRRQLGSYTIMDVIKSYSLKTT